jgi:hypothetical protein
MDFRAQVSMVRITQAGKRAICTHPGFASEGHRSAGMWSVTHEIGRSANAAYSVSLCITLTQLESIFRPFTVHS